MRKLVRLREMNDPQKLAELIMTGPPRVELMIFLGF